MKIAVVQREDAHSIGVDSGVYYFMTKALEVHVGQVCYLCPDNSLVTRTIENVGRCLNRASYLLSGYHLSPDHNRILSKRLACTFAPRVFESGCDVIFAPNASVEIASFNTDLPIVYRSDLTWAKIVDYYPGCSSLLKFARAEGERVEAAAIGKASALIYPSEWATRSAIEHYHADPSRVHFIPSGANFEGEDIPSRDVAMRHPLNGALRLLWTGVDWERKGGATAYDCLMVLLNRGVDARLVICGCVPPKRYRHPNVEVISFLSKRNPVERRKLSQLFLDANFFLFPTLAEASGIVLCEASAYGLHSLVRDTGGVRGAVTDGENGYLLPCDAKGMQYAERIMNAVRDHSVYDKLVRSSRMAYEERLNWDAWGRAVKPIFEQVIKERRYPVKLSCAALARDVKNEPAVAEVSSTGLVDIQ